MNNSELSYFPKYTNLFGGAMPSAPNMAAMPIGSPAQTPMVTPAQSAPPPTMMDTMNQYYHQMEEMEPDKGSQSMMFTVIYAISAIIFLGIMGFRCNKSKNKGGAFAMYAFVLIGIIGGMGFSYTNEELEPSGYAQLCLFIAALFGWFTQYATGDFGGPGSSSSKGRSSYHAASFFYMAMILFGAFSLSVCNTEGKSNLKSNIHYSTAPTA